jgi:Ca-activated chloride channel family protein
MFVSVLDGNGAPVPGLSANEFVVRENGVRREVLRVSQPATDPIDIALVVDNTAASSAAMQDIRRGVTTFVDAMHAKHFISIVTYAERPTIYANYTHDLAQLQAGIGRLFAIEGSGSYLLDALVELSQELAKRKAERAAIVVLSTDGRSWQLPITNTCSKRSPRVVRHSMLSSSIRRPEPPPMMRPGTG